MNILHGNNMATYILDGNNMATYILRSYYTIVETNIQIFNISILIKLLSGSGILAKNFKQH